MGILISVLVLSFLIFFHELGHFIVAKIFGVEVRTFSIGFGKKLLKLKISSTTYAISLIPLGGYVELKDNDDGSRNSLSSKSNIVKIFILLAGPFFNFLLAFLIYFGLFYRDGQILVPQVGSILPLSPATNILQPKDLIVKIDNQNIKSWSDIPRLIQNSKQHLEIEVLRDGVNLQLTITPAKRQIKNIFDEEVEVKYIGITPLGTLQDANYSILESLQLALYRTIDSSKLILEGLKRLITGAVSVDNVGGVISIVSVTNDASTHGYFALFSLMALISVNLAVLNLLPIPALDGGHIVFNIYEMIFRKKIDQENMKKALIVGWAILLGLMLLGLFNDLNRLFQ